MPPKSNIILIGMPGAGKSTVGVLLAKVTNRSFLDTDVELQAEMRMRLHDIIAEKGSDFFCALEERHIYTVNVRDHVIATGGSAVYSDRAMRYLGAGGVVVYLQLSLDSLKKRLSSLDERGVVIREGQTLDELYAERAPLYEKYADVTVVCDDFTHEQVAAAVLRGVMEATLAESGQ